jgi:hypothetical protein
MPKVRTLLILGLLLLAPVLVHAAQAAQDSGAAAEMVGTWRLAPVQDGETAAGPGSIKLELRLEDHAKGKLAGTAIIPLQGGEKRWPIVDATFDGKTFSFKVDNGESLLAGTMERMDGKFEGHWVANGGEDGGRLTMTRADE